MSSSGLTHTVVCTWTVRPAGIEADAVGVEGALVVRLGVGRRVPGDRYRTAACGPAQVEETAMGVAQRVIPPAIDPDLAPAAAAGTVGAQRHAVAAVRQHHASAPIAVDARHQLRSATCRRTPSAAAAGRRCRGDIQHRHLAWRALVQQRRHGLDRARRPCPSAAPMPSEQHVGQRDDAHALVVCHESAHRGERARRPTCRAGVKSSASRKP